MNSGRGQYKAEVVANLPLCREHFKLVLRLKDFPATRPGQFVQLACDDLAYVPEERDCAGEEWPQLGGTEISQREAFLRRPFSLAGRKEVNGGVELSIIHRIVGVGTGWMSRLREGQVLSLLGPLGNWFRPPAENQMAILVGGGVGIPPMLYWAEHLKGRRAVAICGTLSRDLLPLTIIENLSPSPGTPACGELSRTGEGGGEGIDEAATKDKGTQDTNDASALSPSLGTPARSELSRTGEGRGGSSSSFIVHRSSLNSDPHPNPPPEYKGREKERTPTMCIGEFADCGIPSIITTDDGTLGVRGFVTTALKTLLDSLDTEPVIYTCGPEAMMKAVAEIALAGNIECQVAVERAMACGMGTCQSCVIRVKKPDPAKPPLAGSDWCYRLACTDGPIFQAADLLW